MDKPTKKYHHGNLREVLIDRALAIVRTSGEDGLSLRAVARASGVSPNAPYRHFRTKEDLISVLVSHGFDHLTAELFKIPSEGSMKRFRAAGELFERFARENKTLFKLMFRQPSEKTDPDLSEAKNKCFLALAELVRVLMEEVTINGKVTQGTMAAWSLFSGYSILVTDRNHPLGQPFDEFSGKEMAKLLARGLRD